MNQTFDTSGQPQESHSMLTIPLQPQLQQFIVQQLPKVPRLADAAKALHLSSRTLQRVLQHNNCSFRLVVNQCRHRMAKQYLQDSELSLQQIAFELGFEEQSSFQKAFKGWQGCSPGRFRQYKQYAHAQRPTESPGVAAGDLWNY